MQSIWPQSHLRILPPAPLGVARLKRPFASRSIPTDKFWGRGEEEIKEQERKKKKRHLKIGYSTPFPPTKT